MTNLRSVLGVSFLLAHLVLVHPATAQHDPPVDLSLKGAPLSDVLASFAAVGGVELDASPDVTGLVDTELDGVPWTTALTLVCHSHRLACRVTEDRLEVRPVGFAGAQPIDMSLREAPLVATLEAFARVAGAPIEIDPAVEGTVTVELDGVPWPDALVATCRVGGCRTAWTDSGVRITPALD